MIVVALVSLQACTGKVTQKTTQAIVPEAASAAVLQSQAPSAMLPSFAVQDAAGHQLDLAAFKGKKVFVNLWATWCPPCRAEMPSINKLYQAADKEKVQFVMLSLDNDFETAKTYVREKSLELPVFYPAADLPPLFTVNGIPTTFIFNEEGQLIAQHEGSQDYNTAEYRQLFGAAK